MSKQQTQFQAMLLQALLSPEVKAALTGKAPKTVTAKAPKGAKVTADPDTCGVTTKAGTPCRHPHGACPVASHKAPKKGTTVTRQVRKGGKWVTVDGPRPAKKAPTGKAPKKALTKANRRAFVKAAPWAEGLSTKEIATAVVSGAHKAPKGFRIGERYTALVKGA